MSVGLLTPFPGRSFLRPRAVEHCRQRVISFVAIGFVDLILDAILQHERSLGGKWAHVHVGLDRRDLISQVGRVQTGEFFDEMELFVAHAVTSILFPEIGGIDHERVAFPMTDGIALPETNRLRKVRTIVGWDDAISTTAVSLL